MAVHRIDWQAAAAAGDTVEIVALLAGCAHVLTRDGVTMASVTWTDDADPAWHAGTSPSTRGWLDLEELTIEERISPIDGGLDVSGFTLRLADANGAVTAFLASRDLMPMVLLAADLSDTATTMVVQSTGQYPSSGVLHIGRERITYAGATSTSFTGLVRGTAGTKAMRHARAQRPRVYGGDHLPALVGRRVTLWAVRKIGGTWTDPSLIYDGRVSASTRLSSDGGAWEIPVDHAVKALAERVSPTTVQLYGYAHFGTHRRGTAAARREAPRYAPLVAQWDPSGALGEIVLLNGDTAYPDGGGWSASAEEYLIRWNAAAQAVSANVRLERASVVASASPGRRLLVSCAWDADGGGADPPTSSDVATTARVAIPAMPQACVWLDGLVRLDDADAAQIPAAPSSTAGVTVAWGLEVERDNGLTPKATIRATIAPESGNVFALGALLDTTDPRSGERYLDGGMLLTRPTLATLRLRVQVEARASGWWQAVRYGVLAALDGWRGLDHLADSFAWDRVASMAAGQQPWNVARTYWIAPEEAPLDVVRNEAILSGLVLATHRGRIAVARVREVSGLEATSYVVTQASVRRGQRCSYREIPDGIISSVRYILPGGDDAREESFVRVVDGAAQAESGPGAELVARVPEGAIPGGSSTALVTDPTRRGLIERVALATIAPWTRTYIQVTVPCTLAAAGVEVGDVIDLDEYALPDGRGARGIAQRGVVIGHRRSYRAGRVDLHVRVAPVRAGWAPAYLVASITGADCAISGDPCGVGGLAGFADDQDETGAARTDAGLGYLVAGQAVRLVELDARTPATPLDAEVVAVDPVTRTVTLDGAPGATWATRATAGTALMIPADYAGATATQREYVHIADGISFEITTGVAPRRWA